MSKMLWHHQPPSELYSATKLTTAKCTITRNHHLFESNTRAPTHQSRKTHQPPQYWQNFKNNFQRYSKCVLLRATNHRFAADIYATKYNQQPKETLDSNNFPRTGSYSAQQVWLSNPKEACVDELEGAVFNDWLTVPCAATAPDCIGWLVRSFEIDSRTCTEHEIRCQQHASSVHDAMITHSSQSQNEIVSTRWKFNAAHHGNTNMASALEKNDHTWFWFFVIGNHCKNAAAYCHESNQWTINTNMDRADSNRTPFFKKHYPITSQLSNSKLT